MTDKDFWEIARLHIEHEDDLIGQRLTWLLVTNGFLFAAFAAGVSAFEKTPHCAASVLLGIGLVTIAAVGAASGLTALNLTDVATDHIKDVQSWWYKLECSKSFPPIIGNPKRRYRLGFLPYSLTWLLITAWGVMVVLLIVLGLISLFSKK